MRNALVIAHPDDEVLWFGGLVLQDQNSIVDDWEIICCSVPRRDSIRAWKFFDAVAALGPSVRGRLIPSIEPEPTEPLSPDILGLVTNHLQRARYDRIVTHGIEGEYGHAHHISLSEHILARSWGCPVWSTAPSGGVDYDKAILLRDGDLAAKVAALKCYDHVLPYEGVEMPKWEALLKRYGKTWDLGIERYRIKG